MNRLLAFLFQEGVLDDHFMQLHQLQDESTPNFVSDVFSIFFRESEKLLRTLGLMMHDGGEDGSSSSSGAEAGEGEEEDEQEKVMDHYKKVGVHLNQFIGSSSSVGAKRVRSVCIAFRAAAEHHSRSGCMRLLEVLEYEYCYLKNKLYEFFQLEQQRLLVGGVRYLRLP